MTRPQDARQSAPEVALRTALARRIQLRTTAEGLTATPIPGLQLYCRSAPADCGSTTYIPRLIVFVQGRKVIELADTFYDCTGSTFLLTSVELPVSSRIVEASQETPLLGILLDLDMAVVRELLARDEMPPAIPTSPKGMALGTTTRELLEPCIRLVDLLDSPRDIPFLAPLIEREILYRLLSGAQGHHLRAIATLGDQGHRTAKAIAWLRSNFAKPLRVEDLASVAQMGVSTFHHHFRALTAMSPLQYQKRLRLHMAHQRLLSGDLDAAGAAFEVGYESPSQFSREYRRLYGQPPIRNVRTLRPAAQPD